MPDLKTKHRKVGSDYVLTIVSDEDLSDLPLDCDADGNPVFVFGADPGPLTDDDGEPILKRGKTQPAIPQKEYEKQQRREAIALVEHHLQTARATKVSGSDL